MQSTELESIDHHICGSVWTSPLRLIESISYDFGPRPSGSKALRDATTFVATLWRDLGVENVHTETVTMTAWRQGHAAVKMASPQKRHYDCFQHNFSSPGKVTARLLSAGNAFEEDLDRIGKRIEGSILLIDGMVHGLPEKEVALFPRRIARIARRKPAGIIFANAFPHAGAVIETASVLGNASIPVMGISYEDGCELKSFVRQGEAGSVIMFDSRLWHAANHNDTTEPRISITIRYAAWWLNLDVLRPDSDDRKRMVDVIGGEENLILLVKRKIFDGLPEEAKPLWRHWVEPESRSA